MDKSTDTPRLFIYGSTLKPCFYIPIFTVSGNKVCVCYHLCMSCNREHVRTASNFGNHITLCSCKKKNVLHKAYLVSNICSVMG